MTFNRLSRPLMLALVVCAPSLGSAAVVVPNAYENVGGNNTFTGPLSRFARTYQLLIDDSQLTALTGQTIIGVTWRLPASATANWPVADVSYDSFDIYLSAGAEIADRTTTLSSNIVGTQTQVRSGPMTVPAGSFVDNGTTLNPFGHVFEFDTPYLYTGGNLVLEIRQSIHDGADRSTDAVSTASSTGYGTNFAAYWGSGAAATTGIQSNAIVTQFVVPEPASLGLLVFSACGLLRRRR